MAWVNEAPVPFTFTTTMYFSPIVSDVVYVIDRALNFWKYNMDTKIWTQLANPSYTATNCYRSLAISPDGLKIATISEGGADEPVGRRIDVYTIATNTWAASAQSPTIGGSNSGLKSLVWADNDIIWCWATSGAALNGACIRYVVSTDTFTAFAATTGVQTIWQGRCTAINAAGTIVYGGHIGAATNNYFKYTIATDTYASGTASATTNFSWSYDKDKIWFHNTTTYRQGYVNTADDSNNADAFPENTGRTAGYGTNYGVLDDLTSIIAFALSTTPWVMSISGDLTVTTDALTSISGTTATGNGTITSIGLSAVTEHGHCWNTAVDPTTANSKTTKGAGSLGAFTSSITGLTQGTLYYVRAYATNTQGTVYGANQSFTAGYPSTQAGTGRLKIKGTTLRYVGTDGKEYTLTGT